MAVRLGLSVMDTNARKKPQQYITTIFNKQLKHSFTERVNFNINVNINKFI